MSTFWNRFTVRVAAVLGILAAISGPAARAADSLTPSSGSSSSLAGLFDDPVLAKGTGVEVKLSTLEEAFTLLLAKRVVRNQTVSEAERPYLKARLLDELVISRLLVNRATAEDRSNATERVEKARTEFNKSAESGDLLRRQLKARGMSAEQYHAQVLEEELARTVLDREVKSKITITDAQLQDFYANGTDATVLILQGELERLAKAPNTTVDQLAAVKKRIDELRQENLSRLQTPERVRVSHVLIATRDRQTEQELTPEQKKVKRELAEKVLARAKAGEDFAKLVQEFSEDRNLAKTKGEYTFSRGDPFAVEFKAAAFSLNTNQISDVVLTVFGYHVIKLLERLPAKKIELEKVASEVRSALLDQETQRQMPEFFARLKKESGVQILDARYDLEKRGGGPRPGS